MDTHEPATARERDSVRQFVEYLAVLEMPFDEAADPTHVTASAIVLDGAGMTALHLHKRLGLWLQPGGHIDPGEDPFRAARRETHEELGLDLDRPDPPPLIHVDVHDGGRGHLHLDLRYLLLASPNAPLEPAEGESQDARWVPVGEIDQWGDASVGDAVRAATRWLDQV